jgi:hypothetical protein
MKRTGTLRPRFRASRTVCRVEVTVTPFLRATLLDFCIVGPSAIGSVKGRPSSITSATDQVLGRAIGKGLDCTSASSFHAEHDPRSLLRSGIACSDIGDESSPLLFLALSEGRFDLLHVAGLERYQCRGRYVNWKFDKFGIDNALLERLSHTSQTLGLQILSSAFSLSISLDRVLFLHA